MDTQSVHRPPSSTTTLSLRFLQHRFLQTSGAEAAAFACGALAHQQVVAEFVRGFFDQNPLSQLGIIITRDGRAERVTDLSGNPKVVWLVCAYTLW
jgi:Ssl1-like